MINRVTFKQSKDTLISGEPRLGHGLKKLCEDIYTVTYFWDFHSENCVEKTRLFCKIYKSSSYLDIENMSFELLFITSAIPFQGRK